VASQLQAGEVGTLLFDLLTPEEDSSPENRFNIELLTTRLLGAIEWIRNDEVRQHLPLGIFGASTGAASMLRAAALSAGDISAVVSRGGRPDLAEGFLERVRCPTLFIVGGEDSAVLACNRAALLRLGSSERHLEVIPGATHLFPEEGALERVAAIATAWFQRYLRAKR
jgi:putative phosphoribosyl transferase